MSQDKGREQSCSGSRLPAAGVCRYTARWLADLHLLSQSGNLQTGTQCQGNLTFHSPQRGSPEVTLDHCCVPASRAGVLCQATGPQAEPCIPVPGPSCQGYRVDGLGDLLAALTASLPLHPCQGHRSGHHSFGDVGSLSPAQPCPLLASSLGGWAAIRAALGSAPGVPSMWLEGRARTLGSAAGELKPLSATYMAGRQEPEDAKVLGHL